MNSRAPEYYIVHRIGGKFGIKDRMGNLLVDYCLDMIKAPNKTNELDSDSDMIAIRLDGKWALTTIGELISISKTSNVAPINE